MLAKDRETVGAVIKRLEDPSKWIKGQLQYGDRYCIAGALWVEGERCFYGGPPQASRIRRAIRDASYIVTGKNFLNVTDFNDHPDTTHEVVIEVLKIAERLL